MTSLGSTDVFGRALDEVGLRLGIPVVGGQVLRVKTTPTHHIDVCPMLFNWRLITTPVRSPAVYDRGWCYTGKHALIRAVGEALAWPDHDGVEHVPDGWYKTAAAGMADVRRPEHAYP